MFVFFSKNNNNKKSVSKAGSLLCPWKKLVMINSLHHQITDFIRATRGHTTFPIFFRRGTVPGSPAIFDQQKTDCHDTICQFWSEEKIWK